jgi:epoxyqueuosine reductase
MKQCDGWYVHDRNPLWIRRNALIILGNSAEPTSDTAAIIDRYVQSTEPVLRAHAVWAAARLGLTSLIPVTDDHEMVRDELAHLPTLRSNL